MRTYVAKRLLLILPTLFGVAALVFFIMRVIPGDVTLLILGGDQAGRIDPSQIAAMKHQLGLDQPLLVQFGSWLWGVLHLPMIGPWFVSAIISATVGACVLLFVLRLIKR